MTVFLFVILELEFALEEKQRVLSSRPNYKEEYHALKTQVGTRVNTEQEKCSWSFPVKVPEISK